MFTSCDQLALRVNNVYVAYLTAFILMLYTVTSRLSRILIVSLHANKRMLQVTLKEKHDK